MKTFITILALFCSITLHAQSYFPIEKSQVQKFKYDESFTNGMDMSMVVKISDETKTIKGENYRIINTSTMVSGQTQSSFVSYVRKDDGSNKLVGYQDGKTGGAEQVFMPYNPKMGDSWEVEGNLYKVLSLTGSISTPTKSYSNCLILEVSDNGSSVLSYFVKNKGLVATGLKMNGEEKLMTYAAD